MNDTSSCYVHKKLKRIVERSAWLELLSDTTLDFESFALGVRRVKRNFLSDLWSESQTSDEDLWKSSARKHLSQFEQQLYSAIQDSAFLPRGERNKRFLVLQGTF